jgi:ketosteroid isomerase-like protein
MNVCSTQPARLSMRSCIRRGVIAFLAVAAVAAAQFCGFPARASQDNALVDLARIREEWVQDLHAKRLEPILKSYAPDAVFLQPNGDRIVGSAALRSLFQNIMSSFTSDLTLHSRNLEASGDLAYDSGDFEESLTNLATAAKIASKGSYVVIYKRQPDGSWKIVQHVWTGIPPAGT